MLTDLFIHVSFMNPQACCLSLLDKLVNIITSLTIVAINITYCMWDKIIYHRLTKWNHTVVEGGYKSL